MSLIRRIEAAAVAVIIASAVVITPAAPLFAETEDTVDIAFIHDLHSYLDGYYENADGGVQEVGGVARIKTVLDDLRQDNPDLITLDGGDFSMGTLYQTIYTTHASELRTLGYLGVDATTVGNHEFDCGAQGFYDMFEAALDSGDPLPEFVISNIDWDKMEAEGLTDDQQLYKDCFEDYGVSDYTIIERGGKKIAVIGIFGKDAIKTAPTCVLSFEDQVEAAKKTCAYIKANEDVDMIVALSHSGLGSAGSTGQSEDEELAKEVQDLDLIISAHSHTAIFEPIVVGNVTIVAAGCYGRYVGHVVMKADGDNWVYDSYELISVDETVAKDADAEAYVASFRPLVDEEYLSNFGYSWDEILAYNPYEFESVDDCYINHTEQRLGDILSDSFVYAANLSDTAKEEGAFDIAVAPSGCIRGTFAPGYVTAADAFNSYSLGFGEDGLSGYPLVSVYLTGEELLTACEIDASISDLMTSARLYFSGLSFTYNPNRRILNKVTDVVIVKPDGTTEPLDPDKTYHIAVDLYSMQMLGAVTDMSKGLLKVVPKDKDGNPITDPYAAAIYTDGKELKAWDAVAIYVSSFEEGEDGVPVFPEYYSQLHDRKVVDDSKDIKSFMANPNKFSIAFSIVKGLIVSVPVMIVTLAVMRKRRKKEAALAAKAKEQGGKENEENP
ncbi:MAG: 5'-nucleotidase C-terminal domain-containing protein [Saccharofermentans sp.]|nr:5'-nucleotidase C-terminal domain-containing protein [Saccharofermentans sp.]